ncbi:type II toxin-antitoxin system mRNA interferase toxin, RelE/StbE family [Campylobacter sputorum]|nr:type II toxin-antitoxin system mRNA interferase toxin, RelE/StbE family [Campylobacter sputorum subsp. sputorum]
MKDIKIIAYKNHEECHIRPDFLLIYRKENKILVLTLVDLGSHSELFD